MKKILILPFILFSIGSWGQSTLILPTNTNKDNPIHVLKTNNIAMGFSHTNGTTSVGTYITTGGGYIQTHTNHPLLFTTGNGEEKMRLSYSSTPNLDGNLGIGTSSPQEKLHVVGNIRASSLAGTGVRNVSADANGTLTIAPRIAFAAQGIIASNLLVPHTTYTTIPFATEEYDLSNNYNSTTGVFKAPQNGIYHFDAYALWAPPTTSVGKFNMQIIVDGTYYMQTGIAIVAAQALSSQLSTDIKLITGQEVRIDVYQTSGVNQSIFFTSHFTRFTGRLVMPL